MSYSGSSNLIGSRDWTRTEGEAGDTSLCFLQQKSPKGFDMAPGTGLEPATSKLTASCSTIELPGNNESTLIIAYFSILW